MVYFLYNDYMDFIKCGKSRIEESSFKYELSYENYNKLEKEKIQIISKLKNKRIIIKMLKNYFYNNKISDIYNISYNVFKENPNII